MRSKKRIPSVVICLVAVCALFTVFALATDGAESVPTLYATFWSLVPPIIAIGLALITKEAYSSLFIGIVAGALLTNGFKPVATMDTILADGFIGNLADPDNMAILIFLVVLGIVVAIISKAGGSAAYGKWASEHIHSKVGAMLSTIVLGVLIFIDDYFNCLTVGSVMRPVTDSHKMSRAKLAYIIDATAAPICMIAPISSWAASVSSYVDVEGYTGLQLFIHAIPFNYYSLLTIVMLIFLAVTKFDFGPMKKYEAEALAGNDTSALKAFNDSSAKGVQGKVIDLVLPIILVMLCCISGMLYTGGFFGGTDFITAFADCDPYYGLAFGSIIALILIFVYFIIRRTMKFTEIASAIPDGFKAMVPSILILSMAWGLKSMTSLLGAKEFVSGLVKASAGGFANFLPAIIFLIAVGLSFATGTSWGTFGILLPLVLNVVPADSTLLFVAMSSCLAGAVCGDHCSPISDTTIMSSAGAQADHLLHVSTQLPYALTVAAVSFVSFVIAGFWRNAVGTLIVAIALMIGTLLFIRMREKKKAA